MRNVTLLKQKHGQAAKYLLRSWVCVALAGYKNWAFGMFFFKGKKKVKALELHESERERESKRGTALWLVIL